MRDDALPIRRIVVTAFGLAVTVAILLGVVVAMLAHRDVPPGGVPVARPAQLGDDLPMLQTAPQQDLAAFRREKAQALDSLGWVDAASGVTHVPIDTAMSMLLARAASGATR